MFLCVDLQGSASHLNLQKVPGKYSLNFFLCFLNSSSKATTVLTKCCQIGAVQVLPLFFTQLKSGSNMLAKMPFQLVPKAQSRMARWAHGFISSFSIVYIYIYKKKKKKKKKKQFIRLERAKTLLSYCLIQSGILLVHLLKSCQFTWEQGKTTHNFVRCRWKTSRSVSGLKT